MVACEDFSSNLQPLGRESHMSWSKVLLWNADSPHNPQVNYWELEHILSHPIISNSFRDFGNLLMFELTRLLGKATWEL